MERRWKGERQSNTHINRPRVGPELRRNGYAMYRFLLLLPLPNYDQRGTQKANSEGFPIWPQARVLSQPLSFYVGRNLSWRTRIDDIHILNPIFQCIFMNNWNIISIKRSKDRLQGRVSSLAAVKLWGFTALSVPLPSSQDHTIRKARPKRPHIIAATPHCGSE